MNYIERMEKELEELVERGTKLDKALSTLELTKEEYGLMYAQSKAMSLYADILAERIEKAKK